jgi:hypothetical protein
MGFTMHLIHSTKITRVRAPRGRLSSPQPWGWVVPRVILP